MGHPTRVASIFSAVLASVCSVEPAVLVMATVYDPRFCAMSNASTVRVVSPELDNAMTAVPAPERSAR